MVILKGDQECAFKEVNECQAGYILLIFVMLVVSVNIGRWERGSGWGIHVTPWLIHVNV